MQKLISFLSRLGVTRGLTFRCDIEDGVGPIISPNPCVNRMQPQFIFASGHVDALPKKHDDRRFCVPPTKRTRGDWKAKPLHVTW